LRIFLGQLHGYPSFECQNYEFEKKNCGPYSYFHSICCTVAPITTKKIQLSDQSMGKGATTWSKQGQWCKVEKIVQIPN
jgi:hypothetical protein